MGLGSNPNLQMLDQLGMQVSQGHQFGLQGSQGHPLNWQQQGLLQQQQHQQYLQHKQLQQLQQQQQHYPNAPGLFSQGLPGGFQGQSGFQNHLGHQLPPVPSWQGSASGQQGTGAGQYGSGPEGPGLLGNDRLLHGQFGDTSVQV